MAIPPELQDTDPVNNAITTLNFQKGFKRLPDKIPSSPSSCHMAHYNFLAKDEGLSHILARVITLPFQHGFSLIRWHTAVHFILEKEPENHLNTQAQSDTAPWNRHEFCILPTVGKTTCASCPCTKHNNPLPPNFGGRRGCKVHGALLLKTLSLDLIQYACLNDIVFNNNTKACFGRIVSSKGLMATECLGMPTTTTICRLATIQGTKFFIQTAHSVSPGFFTSTLSALILGVLQGSRAVPWIWLSICGILLHTLITHTTGFQAACPCYSKNSKHPWESFADNTDLWLISNSHSPSRILVSSMQKVAQLWECLSCASGGTMAIPKCFHYLVDWYWNHKGFPILSSNTNSSDPQLVMTSGRSILTNPIPKSKTTLGSALWECVYLKMDLLEMSSHIASSKH